jgi:hypothetical protein
MATMVHQSHTNELRHSFVVRRPALIKPCGPWRFLRQSPNRQSSASNTETAERWRQKRSPEISLTERGAAKYLLLHRELWQDVCRSEAECQR